MRIEQLLSYIKDYEPMYKELILRAYEFADEVHKGVKRKSGEDYIIHPISVACILAEMQADADTIAAGLLHDTIEDGIDITKELLAEKFNPKIAELVDGVTKMKNVEFGNDKKLLNEENTRKIIEGLTQDIRILIIKLADRLHNMRTLEFHKPHKQIEISRETMSFFVPFAALIGEYTFKQELEDLSFKYLRPHEYQNLKNLVDSELIENRPMIDKIILEISQILNSENVPFDIKVKVKNIYGLYKRLRTYNRVESIHDFFTIKYIINDIDKCYWLRDRIKDNFKNIPEREKDYIANPKSNMYRSLHNTIELDDRMYQIQLKTREMYLINSYGLPAYWSTMLLDNPVARMENDVRSLQVFRLLEQLVNDNLPTLELNKLVREEILSSNIVVISPCGESIELPVNSTPIDYAYYINADLGNYIIGAIVNGERVPLDYKLKTDDVIEIIINKDLYGPREDMYEMCGTDYSKRKIKEFNKKHGI